VERCIKFGAGGCGLSGPVQRLGEAAQRQNLAVLVVAFPVQRK
jgi:hypothetical protein